MLEWMPVEYHQWEGTLFGRPCVHIRILVHDSATHVTVIDHIITHMELDAARSREQYIEDTRLRLFAALARGPEDN